jgi:hypothetical protein
MRALLLLWMAVAMPLCAADEYEPLRLYAGKWRAIPADATSKPDELVDECALTGKYFTCQQTVNGKVGALLVFVPTGTPGHYYTNAITPDGYAGGRGELEIVGERWVYSSKSPDGKFHRTLNLFTGRDKIHFELSDSTDGEHWEVRRSGDEVRVK